MSAVPAAAAARAQGEAFVARLAAGRKLAAAEHCQRLAAGYRRNGALAYARAGGDAGRIWHVLAKNAERRAEAHRKHAAALTREAAALTREAAGK